MKKNRVLFYSSVNNIQLFEITGFYLFDIKALELCGYKVLKTNSYKSFLKFWTYDISFLYFYKKSILPAIISFFFRKNILYSGGVDELSTEVNINSSLRNIYKSLFVFNYLLSSRCNIVSTNDFINTTKVLHQFGIKNISKLVYFPHCIDTQNKLFSNFHKKENIFTTICWMGSIENVKRKGLDKSLEIFKIFLSRNPNFKFYIIGTHGEGKDYLQDVVNSLDITNHVVFTGALNENNKIELLQRSKFYFQISLYEGFGLAVLEAMICRNIIIHSGKGGLSDTIGERGILISKNDSLNKVVQSIESVFNNLELNSIELEENKEFVENKFQINQRALNFEKIIQKNES